MTVRENRKLMNIKSLVKEAYDIVNDDIHSDISHIIEDLAVELELNTIFNDVEIKQLLKNKYKISKDKKSATKKYRNMPIRVIKIDFNEYVLTLGNVKMENFEDVVVDITDVLTNSLYFNYIFRKYKKLK